MTETLEKRLWDLRNEEALLEEQGADVDAARAFRLCAENAADASLWEEAWKYVGEAAVLLADLTMNETRTLRIDELPEEWIDEIMQDDSNAVYYVDTTEPARLLRIERNLLELFARQRHAELAAGTLVEVI